jgi:nucleoid DNA-binding protein
MQTSNLTKREIVLSIYEKTNLPQKDIQTVVQLCLDNIQAALAAGRDVELRNFGVFEVQVRKARVGRNPNRPETDVTIPERAVVKFKAGKELKAQLKQIQLESIKARSRGRSAASEEEE